MNYIYVCIYIYNYINYVYIDILVSRIYISSKVAHMASGFAITKNLERQLGLKQPSQHGKRASVAKMTPYLHFAVF